MKAKRMLSLVMAAVLALCVLAGCRGGRTLSQVMAGLLEGQYQNVAVEADPDLEAALRSAVREGGELADILARLQQELGLGGGTLTLRGLGGGRQGEHAVELRFEPGSDPDTAARKAFADWDAALARLPSDGQYAAEIAMVEAEGGYYIAVDVKIVKAGKPDTDDDAEPEEPYTVDKDGNYTVNTPKGLMALFEKENKDDFVGKTITLQAGETYTVNKRLADAFRGTLTSNGSEDNRATIEITGGPGLFGTIGKITKPADQDTGPEVIDNTGIVQNLKIKVTGSITGGDGSGGATNSTNAGAVAGENFGTISNCEVTVSGSIKASISNDSYAFAGAVAGENRGTISGCIVTISGTVSASNNRDSGNARAGGVVGSNVEGKISGCEVTIKSTGSISADAATGISSFAYAGGVAGDNKGTVEDSCSCTLEEGGKIEAKVGENIATVPFGGSEHDQEGNASAGIEIGDELPDHRR